MRTRLLILFVFMLVLAACGPEEDPPAPTSAPPDQPTVIALGTNTPTPGGPTRTPSPTFLGIATQPPLLATLAADTPLPPTNTPAPFEVVVQSGQTCLELALRYRVSVDSIRELNGLGSGCVLQINQRLLIPHPSATPTPLGLGETKTAVYEALPPNMRNVTPFAIGTYCPVEGDTLTSISLKNDTTNQRICELNDGPDGMDCRGCDFSESVVGFCPNPPPISLNQCYKVPAPTPTMTYTPTFTGMETATPTPTYLPPQAIYPQSGAIETGRVRLAWVLPGGQLRSNEAYVVTATDELTGEQLYYETRDTTFNWPDEWIPATGQQRQIVWSVQVAVRDASGVYVPVSGRSMTKRFTWQG